MAGVSEVFENSAGTLVVVFEDMPRCSYIVARIML